MEKYVARHCMPRISPVHYSAYNCVRHTQTSNTAANNCVSLRDERKKYTQSSIHIALSRPEPIEKSVQGRCRAVCPAQGVQRGDEIHPCASHGCECLSSQKRLLRGGCYAARSRTQGRGGQPGAESHNKKNGSLKKSPKGRYVKMKFLRILRCRGLSPAGRFLRGEKPLKLPKHFNTEVVGFTLFYFILLFFYACASRSLFYASLLQSSLLVGNLCWNKGSPPKPPFQRTLSSYLRFRTSCMSYLPGSAVARNLTALNAPLENISLLDALCVNSIRSPFIAKITVWSPTTSPPRKLCIPISLPGLAPITPSRP